jgi:hypothetical protein
MIRIASKNCTAMLGQRCSSRGCRFCYFTTLSVFRLCSSNSRMTDEYEWIWKEAVVVQSRYCPGISLEGLSNITKPSR